MDNVPLPIKSLPPPLIDHLRSTIIITSLPQAVLELVQNSLDAKSTLVEIDVDFDNWNIKCRDDGTGIDEESLRILGEGRYGELVIRD
jgi:DNA mismatch repair ATPase MutL